MPEYTAIISTPIGKVGFYASEQTVLRLDFLSDTISLLSPTNKISITLANELTRYFEAERIGFSVPAKPTGTAFQLNVWRALQRIPTGSTLSYGELAKSLSTSPRAIGQACRTNPIPIIIPCHRVIAKNHLGGFMGEREGNKLDIKRRLLNHENNQTM